MFIKKRQALIFTCLLVFLIALLFVACIKANSKNQIIYIVNNKEYKSEILPSSITSKEKIKKLNSIMVKGYKFISWMHNNKPVDKIYYSKKIDKIKLIAKLEIINYDIKYANTLTAKNSNPLKYNINSKDQKLENISVDGMIFLGWFLDKNYKNQIYEINPSILKNIIIYAKLNKLYNITYENEGGIISSESKTTYHLDEGLINLPFPYKLGYEFMGYYIKNNSTINKMFVLNASTKKDVILVATYKKNSYAISYELNDGSLDNPIMEYNIEQEIILKEPTKHNHIFQGWFTSSNFDGEKIVKIEKGSIGNRRFYAKYASL